MIDEKRNKFYDNLFKNLFNFDALIIKKRFVPRLLKNFGEVLKYYLCLFKLKKI